MPVNINHLRELIRIGEFLEENYKDDAIRNKWIFDVSIFVDSLESTLKQYVSSPLSTLRNMPPDFMEMVNFDNLKKVLGFLRSIYNQDSSSNKPIAKNSQAVFIVHGHDDDLISEVKACVTELGLKPIVLREQADKGLTIIEKLEDWLGNCKCVIVLYTPCDVGKAIFETSTEERARQNVVYEHGLFQGFLGRKRVVALKKGNTILPGDCKGLVYTSVDDNGWREQLKKNIRAIDQ